MWIFTKFPIPLKIIENSLHFFTIRYKIPKIRACFLALLLISSMNSENLTVLSFVQVNYEALNIEYLKFSTFFINRNKSRLSAALCSSVYRHLPARSFKVHIFWGGHRILRFLKHLWPSQNIWTLSNTERYIIVWMESLMNYKWKSYDSKKVLISLGNWVRWKLPDTSKRASSWILDQLVISYLDSNPPILRWRP